MRKIDEKIMEMRIRQSNRKWIAKEILLCVVVVALAVIFFSARS